MGYYNSSCIAEGTRDFQEQNGQGCDVDEVDVDIRAGALLSLQKKDSLTEWVRRAEFTHTTAKFRLTFSSDQLQSKTSLATFISSQGSQHGTYT